MENFNWKKAISEIKYLLDWPIRRLKVKDENFSKFEGKSIRSTQSKEKKGQKYFLINRSTK